jgi:hypothetical protein
MKTDESKFDDDSKANFLSDFVENIRESLGVEPSTSSAEPEDDSNLESALGDRLNQDQVTIKLYQHSFTYHVFPIKVIIGM